MEKKSKCVGVCMGEEQMETRLLKSGQWKGHVINEMI